MMLSKYTIACMLAFASCTQERASQSTTAETASAADSSKEVTMLDKERYCFVSSENRDTTKVAFTITDNQVIGQMDWIPFEKDAKKGSLKGTIDGNIVRALWTYMQEGVQDTVTVSFNVSPDRLEQKPFIYNEKSQRLQTDESAGFTIKYTKGDCPISK